MFGGMAGEALVEAALPTAGRIKQSRGERIVRSGASRTGEGHVRLGDSQLAREARFARFLRAWWSDERPDWTGLDWWDAPLRDEVRGLLWLPPGPELVTALAEFPAGGVCSEAHAGESPPGWPTPGHSPGWPCACKVVLAAAWEACAAWVAAGSAGALVDAAGSSEVTFTPPRPAPAVSDPAREELALALRTSPTSTGNRIAAARELCAHPELRALVESAAISSWGARLVVLELSGLPDDVVPGIVTEVVELVRARLTSGRRPWTSAEVGRTARRVRLRRAPEHEQVVRARALADRKVQVFADRDGMAVLHALLESTEAHRMHRRLSAIAEGMDDPQRTRDQVRADTLVDLVLGGVGTASQYATGSDSTAGVGAPDFADRDPDDRDPDDRDGADRSRADGDRAAHDPADRRASAGRPLVRPEINVVVSLETLLGLVDDPAHVPGVGPIGAEVARALAAEGAWRAWVTDATTGRVATTGTRTYVPTEEVARLVRAREPHCRMPGCRRAAQRCDLDHAIPWPEGPTSPANLGPLCRRHHVLKTHAGWQLQPSEPAAAGRRAVAPDPPDPLELPEPLDLSEPLDPPDLPDPPDSTPSRVVDAHRTSAGWTWRTPAGFTVCDEERPPLE